MLSCLPLKYHSNISAGILLLFPGSGAQRDVKWNACCTALFSANGMDIFIVLLTKLAENLLRPWRHGQPLSTGPPLVLVSMATPLLALLKTMLTELLASGTYQFRDRRLMTSLMLLHTVTCSAPMTGQLSGLAQKVGAAMWFHFLPRPPPPRLFLTRSSSSRALLLKPSGEPVGGPTEQ